MPRIANSGLKSLKFCPTCSHHRQLPDKLFVNAISCI